MTRHGEQHNAGGVASPEVRPCYRQVLREGVLVPPPLNRVS
jgi:hypothetical protein